MSNRLLIIDDNEKICKSLIQNFKQYGYENHYATNSQDAYALIMKHHIDLIILDIVIGEENGLEILKNILALNQNIPVIMITGFGTIETAVQSIKMGAFDYVQKPLNFERLLKIVENALKLSALSQENLKLKKRLIEMSQEMITQDHQMIELCAKAKRLAATDIPILITGENGTGKELLADYIHYQSPRNASKLIKINCVAFPEHLLNNKLFGHQQTTESGNLTSHMGVFEKAEKSTLLLDEIGDMPLAIQAKILGFLQNKEINRVGANENIKVNIRLIAVTNKNLEIQVEEKKFRQDLFFRLNTAVLDIPPLRNRAGDIPLLVDHFLKEFSNLNTKAIYSLKPPVMEKFMEYHWPGNIRELRNTLNYAAAICAGDVITIKDLPPALLNPIKPKKSDVFQTSSLEESEKELILRTLAQNNQNKNRTAIQLNISRKTLYNKLKKYGLYTDGR
ncbi:MAG: sigma-54-dependent Fis family transcriptional regulator [Spirochaetales bacterium]|nr:sigma-54-dependent Fis family transcriptional regulator [Spirochaetales bacterium]